MPSNFSTNLKIELQANGENDTTWGSKTNANLEQVEHAIVDQQSVSVGGGVTLSLTNLGSNEDGRAHTLDLTGATGGTATMIVPNVKKTWLVRNDSGNDVAIRTATGSAITLTSGIDAWIQCDGANTVRFGLLDIKHTSVTASTLNVDVINTTGTIAAGSFTATGDITASGTITGGAITTSGTVTASKIVAATGTFDSLFVSGDVTASTITADVATVSTVNANAVTASTITAEAFVATGGGTVRAGTITATGTVNAAKVSATTGTLTDLVVSNAIDADTITVGTLTATGTVSAAKISSTTGTFTDLVVSNVITASSLVADFITVSTVNASSVNAQKVTASTVTAEAFVATGGGTVRAGTITATGNLVGVKVVATTGTFDSLFVSDGILTSTIAADVVTAGAINTSGAVTASTIEVDRVTTTQTTLPFLVGTATVFRLSTSEAELGNKADVLLSFVTANNSAAIEFTTNIDSTYDYYDIEIINAILASDGDSLAIRLSTDAGVSFASGAADYSFGRLIFNDATLASGGAAGTTRIVPIISAGNAAGESISGHVRVLSPSSSNYTKLNWKLSFDNDSGNSGYSIGGGHRTAAQNHDGIRIFGDGSNISSGKFKLWGGKI